MPKVTIVTPCYNAARFIASTIESVRAQTFHDWEHIIVDDGSTDASVATIRRCSSDDPRRRVRLLQQANSGVCHARNVGFGARSKESKYVLFLDADDALKPSMLERLVSHMDAHGEVGLTYCLYDHVDENGTVSPVHPVPERYRGTAFGLHSIPDADLDTPVLNIFCGHAIPSVSLLRVSCFEETDGFDAQLGQPEEDVDVFMQIALQHPVHRLPERLVNYRRHASQITRDTARLEAQRAKLLEKWARPFNEVTRQHAKTVRSVRLEWYGKILPLLWLRAAVTILREGKLGRPVLLFAASATKYFYYVVRSLLRPYSLQ